MEKKILTGLYKYAKQINTSRCGDYIINYCYFCHESNFKRASDMRLMCDQIFQRQHQQMEKLLILLCKKFTDRYHLIYL